MTESRLLERLNRLEEQQGDLLEDAERRDERDKLLFIALTRLAGAIASAGFNINTDEMQRAYSAVWTFTGFDPKTTREDPDA